MEKALVDQGKEALVTKNNTPTPSGRQITTDAELDAFLDALDEANTPEPAVILAIDSANLTAMRPWVLTQDEDGDWWGWSFAYEGEDAEPTRIDDIDLPWTVLHRPDVDLFAAERERAAEDATFAWQITLLAHTDLTAEQVGTVTANLSEGYRRLRGMESGRLSVDEAYRAASVKAAAWEEGYYYATNGKWGPGENPYQEDSDD